jgi:hypothetical protein
MAHIKTNVVARRNARGGRSAAEHLVAALRCLYRHAEDDGLIGEADNPARKVAKPRRLPSTRRALAEVLGDPAQRWLVTPSLRWLFLAAVFGVGDVRSPVGSAFGDGEVGHEVIRCGAMPVLFAVGREDDISGVEFDDLLPVHLNEAVAFGDVQGLPAFVGVPGTSRSGREVDRGHVEL